MKATTIVFAGIVLMLLHACGVSAEEKRNIERAAFARQAARDSVDALVDRMDSSVTETQMILAMTKAELEAARVTLDRVKGWQFGRSRGMRDEQIIQASFDVQRLEAMIAEMESNLILIANAKEETIRKADYMEQWSRAAGE